MESIIIINAFVPNGKASSNKTQVYITKGKNKFIIMDKDFHILPLVIHRTFLNNKNSKNIETLKTVSTNLTQLLFLNIILLNTGYTFFLSTNVIAKSI